MVDLKAYSIFTFMLTMGTLLTKLCTAQDIQQLTVTAGDNVTLPCTLTTDYPTWFGQGLQYNNNGQKSFANPNLPEQKRSRLGWGSDKSSLIIRDVMFSDQGLYQCATVSKINLNIKGSADIIVPRAGNCGEDTVLICQVIGTIANTGWFGLNRSIVINGMPFRPEDSNKYTQTTGNTTFELTIHHTSTNDEGNYRCNNGFDESQPTRLNIECKASSAVLNVTVGKKVLLTVDRLYPSAPSLEVSFKNEEIAITVSGSATCSSSSQYSGFYMCVWTSENSLDDGIYTYSVVVTTITQAAPLHGSFNIVSPQTPVISNVVNREDGREVVVGNEGQLLTIHCTSYGGYPAPSLTWYNSSVSTSNELATTNNDILQSNGTYTVTLQHKFTPTRSDDRNRIICRSYYPQADRTHIASNVKSALLYLSLVPSKPNVTQASEVSAGDVIEVSCKTTGCRPIASISWLYEGNTANGQIKSVLDTVTETYEVVSLFTRRVTAADNGQVIQCIVTHPAITSTSGITASYQLSVNFPPNVSAIATNTTVYESNTVLTCIAKGVPDNNYRYGKWIQRWPGYGVPVSVRPGSESLELRGLTYEHSGFYTCTASNGIKVFGTNTEFIEGTAVQLLVKSFPVIISLADKIASRMNNNITVKVDYFSNIPGTEVKLNRNVNGARKTNVMFIVNKNLVGVELPVFSHFVKTNGTRAIITAPIKSEKDYGSYIVVVSNEIGSSNRSFDVVLTVPPGTPRGFTIDYIQHNKARLSWLRGYNGGLTQTFIIQVGTDKKTWSDVILVDRITKDEKPITIILTDLHDSKTYFVRVYAYNEEGNSPLSETLNFTTSSIKVNVTVKTNNTTAIIVGVVLGILIVVLLVYSIYVTLRMKRRHDPGQNKDISKDAKSREYVNVEDPLKLKTKDVKERRKSPHDVQTSETSQYTELDKDLKEAESAYDAISTI